MTRKVLAMLCLCFLVMAIYKAWEDQYEKADAAARSADLYLHQTHDYQRTVAEDRNTIDKLTSDLFAKTQPNDYEYVQQNRPFIEPKLIVDNASTNAFAYHLEVQNMGKLRADHIKYELTCGDRYEWDNRGTASRELDPGATTTLTPDEIPFSMNPSSGFSVRLNIFYDVNRGQTNISFESSYAFVVGYLRTGTFFPYRDFTDDGLTPEMTDTNAWHLMAQRFEDMPSGHITFIFNDNKPIILEGTNSHASSDGSSSFVAGEIPKRRFDYFPPARVATFRSLSGSGNLTFLRKTLDKNSTTNHYVTLQWNTNGFGMFLDGEFLSAPKNFWNQ